MKKKYGKWLITAGSVSTIFLSSACVVGNQTKNRTRKDEELLAEVRALRKEIQELINELRSKNPKEAERLLISLNEELPKIETLESSDNTSYLELAKKRYAEKLQEVEAELNPTTVVTPTDPNKPTPPSPIIPVPPAPVNPINTKDSMVPEGYADDKEFFTKYPLSNKWEVNRAKEIRINYWADGDTITDTDGVKYRFNGVDTPETRQKVNGTWTETTGQQYEYGMKAKTYTKLYTDVNNRESKKVNGHPVQIYVVPQTTQGGSNKGNQKLSSGFCDPYGRVVAIIYYRNNLGQYFDLCGQLIWFGIARMAYIEKTGNRYNTHNSKQYDHLKRCEKHAIDNQLGIHD